MCNLHMGQVTPGSGPVIMTWNVDKPTPKKRNQFDLDVLLVQYFLFRNGLRTGATEFIGDEDMDGKWGPQMDRNIDNFTARNKVVKDKVIDPIPPGIEITPLHHKIYKIRLLNNMYLLSKFKTPTLDGIDGVVLNGTTLTMPEESDMPKALSNHLKIKRLAAIPDFVL